jgi:ATPase subunit of ABC transporter with duplicated ATPase domains
MLKEDCVQSTMATIRSSCSLRKVSVDIVLQHIAELLLTSNMCVFHHDTAKMDSWHAAYNAQEKKIKEERQWINKFKLKQPQAVKQREAQLEKMIKSPDYVQKPPFTGKPFRFRFPPAPRLSAEVAQVKGLTHGYGDGANRLFDNCEVTIDKGDRIAIIGPNGSGKSTLLRILMGKEKVRDRTIGYNSRFFMIACF